MSQFTNIELGKTMFSFPFSLFLFPYWEDQYMSLDIGFDNIILFFATIIQSDNMHISAKIV